MPDRSARIKSMAVLAVALAAALAAPAPAKETAEPRTRIAVADGATGAVRVLKMRTGRQLARLRVAGPASLTTLPNGRHVVAVQSDEDRVDAIDGGAWSVRHGDHVHHHVVRPRLLPFRLRVPRPVHVVAHGREVAVFADDSGEAHVFGLRALQRRAGDRIRLAASTPHHGVAVPIGDRFVVSDAPAGAERGSLPNAVTVRDWADGTLARFDGCPELHGEASGPGWAAFACEDGVLLVRPHGAGAVERLSYPDRASVEQRAWTLRTGGAARLLVGDFGERALVVFDVAAGAARVLPVGGAIASFDVERDSGG
jgi:hypothetical protein